jgi:hypothetical protein
LSLILDALRRGRGRPTPKPAQHPAQTDAVLRTLGYSRSKPASAGRGNGLAVLLIGGILFVLVIWGVRHLVQ